MTILTVMRHAKSSWGDSGLKDFDRPLNDRGRTSARAVGGELKRRKARFDRVFASPALRVRETLEEVAKGYGKALDVRFDAQIYAADEQTLLDLVRSIPGEVHAPLIVGHNPGLQELLLSLAHDDEQGLRRKVSAKYPTAAVAVVELPGVRWDEVAPDSGEIVELILPRELED
jgi:phosphohistidine phosphatase